MALAVTLDTLIDAVCAWVETAEGAGVPVIVGQESGPRPAEPYAAVWLTDIASPEWDAVEPVSEHAITALSQALRTFTVAGDRRAFYVAGSSVVVADSTGNDGTYTITAAVFAGGSTTITVTEAIPNATADGVLTGSREIVGTRVLTFHVDFVGAGALERAEAARSKLDVQAVVDALVAAGLAPYPAEGIVDATEFEASRRQPRAVLIARFATDSLEHEYVGALERVQGTSTTLDAAGGVVRAETFAADVDEAPPTP